MNAAAQLHDLIVADADLVRQVLAPLRETLAKQVAQGTYDSAKASHQFRTLIDRGAKKYARTVGVLTAADRNALAEMFERDFRAEAHTSLRRSSLGRGSLAPAPSSLFTSHGRGTSLLSVKTSYSKTSRG